MGKSAQSLSRRENGLPVHRSPLIAKLLLRGRRKGSSAPPSAILSPGALLIWRQRSDLRATFDLKRKAGRIGLFWWYLLHGHAELGLEPVAADAAVLDAANLPLPGLVQHGFTPITWLMREHYRRSGLRLPPLRTREGQEQLLSWFFTRGLTDKKLGAFLTPQQADGLRAPQGSGAGIPRIVGFIWQNDEQLHTRFTGPDDPAFLNWCHGEGARDFPILSHPSVALAPTWRPPSRAAGRFGVNLIGHAFHRSGLSEDVRAAALSLDLAGIPFSIYDPGPQQAVANEDFSLASRVSRDLPFDQNLFCFTGESTVTAVIANSELHRDRRFTIGMWPWELPEWPEFWHHAYGYVDEIWASSRFTYDAYCRSSPVPVRHMPMAVTVDSTEGASRADFGLPQNVFLFAFAFDGLSSFARKNPFACVAAFQSAFPDFDQPVGLVIKGLRAQSIETWARLRDQIGNDPRIILITESLSRGRLLDLYRGIDCFVSLHRSEGFGRNIAEAMLLEKPVIVSAHSGNMDFTDHGTAALVPVRLVPLADGAYPFGDGQMWAEADVGAAARLMQRIVTDVPWRSRIAQDARTRIEDMYSPAVVGKRWAEILRSTGA